MNVADLIKVLQIMPPNAVVVGFVPMIEGDDEAGMYRHEMKRKLHEGCTL